MAWTNWILIAYGKSYYTELITHNGSAVYELGLGKLRGSKIQPVYVGETINEKKRICAYAKHGSHISETIDWHLRQGWAIYYRAIATEDKEEAKVKQDNLLKKFDYDWNLQNN